MLRFAQWTNLSETTFLLPPTERAATSAATSADYRVRIFTPGGELPFAGHPTLGTAAVWRDITGSSADEIVQECGVGLVRVRVHGERLAFAAPPLLRGGPVDVATLATACEQLGIGIHEVVDAQWVDNGPGWLGLLLRDADAVLALRPGTVTMDLGVIGPSSGTAHAFEVRAFFPAGGSTREDPVTGSLNASLAQWMLASDRAVAPYRTRQGTALGRAGDVYVDVDDVVDDAGGDTGSVWIGGAVAWCVDGTVML
jgi:PhzF family phenazine biosynthesis protein